MEALAEEHKIFEYFQNPELKLTRHLERLNALKGDKSARKPDEISIWRFCSWFWRVLPGTYFTLILKFFIVKLFKELKYPTELRI